MPTLRSDSPVPRLSKRISREKAPSESWKRATFGFSQECSRCEMKPGAARRSGAFARGLVGDKDLAAGDVACLDNHGSREPTARERGRLQPGQAIERREAHAVVWRRPEPRDGVEMLVAAVAAVVCSRSG